jgi:hypothetical protein
MLQYCNISVLTSVVLAVGLAYGGTAQASGADDGKTRTFMRDSCKLSAANDPHCMMSPSDTAPTASTRAHRPNRPQVSRLTY